MWPWSALARLRSQVASLEATLRERDRQLESLRHDYELLRADYSTVVNVLGGMASRPQAVKLYEDDLFKEDPNQPTLYLTPAPEEPVDWDRVMDRATETV